MFYCCTKIYHYLPDIFVMPATCICSFLCMASQKLPSPLSNCEWVFFLSLLKMLSLCSWLTVQNKQKLCHIKLPFGLWHLCQFEMETIVGSAHCQKVSLNISFLCLFLHPMASTAYRFILCEVEYISPVDYMDPSKFQTCNINACVWIMYMLPATECGQNLRAGKLCVCLFIY